jgi:hypothetical protein
MSIVTGLPAGVTMTGTQTPQKLFGDIPASNANIPGMVTPNITAAMPQYTDWGDVANVMDVANAMKERSRAQWARAAAINNARFAQSRANSGWNQGDVRAPSGSQSSGMGYQNAPQLHGESGIPGFQGSVLWAPRNLRGPALGTWSEKQRQLADAQHKRPPVILQAYADDPYSPGEAGAGIPYMEEHNGPGLTTPLGGANPLCWRDVGGGDGGGQSYGRTRQAQPQVCFHRSR